MDTEDHPFSLAGKVSLVTDGSRGLGLGMAQGLARAGSRLVLVSRGAEQLKQAAADLTAETGAEVAALPWDVREVDSLGELVTRAAAFFGRIDVLVNNAGVQVRKSFLDITPAEYDFVLDINLRAVFFLAQQAARHMIATRVKGRIVNVASLTSRLGIRNTAAYGVSKGGVYSLTKNMAVELAEHGIRVNAVAPGYFRTQADRGRLRGQGTCDLDGVAHSTRPHREPSGSRGDRGVSGRSSLRLPDRQRHFCGRRLDVRLTGTRPAAPRPAYCNVEFSGT